MRQLSPEGVVPKAGRGRYELVPVVCGYIQYLKGRSPDASVMSIDEARQRKAAAEAELVEIELARARGDAVSIEDVAKAWDGILTGVRARMLALPTKIAPLVTHETDQSLVQACIEDAVHTALGECAANLRNDTASEGEPGATV